MESNNNIKHIVFKHSLLTQGIYDSSAGETIDKSCSALIDGQTWCNNDSGHFNSFLQPTGTNQLRIICNHKKSTSVLLCMEGTIC